MSRATYLQSFCKNFQCLLMIIGNPHQKKNVHTHVELLNRVQRFMAYTKVMKFTLLQVLCICNSVQLVCVCMCVCVWSFAKL